MDEQPPANSPDPPLVITRKWYEGARINLAFALSMFLAGIYFFYDIGVSYGAIDERLDTLEADLGELSGELDRFQHRVTDKIVDHHTRLTILENK